MVATGVTEVQLSGAKDDGSWEQRGKVPRKAADTPEKTPSKCTYQYTSDVQRVADNKKQQSDVQHCSIGGSDTS